MNPPKPLIRLPLWVDRENEITKFLQPRQARSRVAPWVVWWFTELKTGRIFFLTYVGTVVVVDRGLGHHGVVLKLALAERRSVGRNENELGLAGAEGLEGAAVSEDNLSGLDDQGKLFIHSQYKPKKKIEAISVSRLQQNKRTLAPMLWASFLDFLGAIATVLRSEKTEIKVASKVDLPCRWQKRRRF